MAASARAQKPVGSAPWIAAEKENMAELVEQEMEEVEYPVRHELDWLNEHMTEIFSKGQTNFADVFKTPGKMRGKTPRTARKRIPEESRVPLSEIFSSAQKQLENQASPSPFIHRVVSKPTPLAASPVPRTKTVKEQASQPEYPDLTQNLNSFPTYNTDSGYHGMPDDDEMVLPDVQQESQASTQPSTQPFEQDEPMHLDTQEVDISVSQQTNEESFHSAREEVRSRGETVEPSKEPTPTQERTALPAASVSKEYETEIMSTPTKKTKPQSNTEIPETQHNKEPETQESDPIISIPEPTPEKAPVALAAPPIETQESHLQDEYREDATEDAMKDDTVLDNLDDIGSPSDGSTPDRPFARKSSLSFATLPAREPLKTRTSHIDLAKMSTAGRPSYFGRQTGSHRIPQAAVEDNVGSRALEIDNEKEPSEEADPEQASRMHSKKSTQSLHDRISMLGKLQPSRPRKSIPSASGLPAGQVPYPDLPASKSEPKSEASNEGAHEAPAPEPMSVDDDWIKPLSSPQKPELYKSKTTDVMEKLAEFEKARAINKKDTSKPEPERPKSSTSMFSSPRPHGHQQSASLTHIAADASTTPTGSPRRFDGHISASKLKLHSIMKSAKGLFSSTGNTPRMEHSSPEQARVQPIADTFIMNAKHLSQPVPITSPQRPEGRRTRSSTEKEEKRRQHERKEQEREDQEEEEARVERAREQERQRALQLKTAQGNSSVEPEERAGSAVNKISQSQRQQSREPESTQESSSRFTIPQPKQNDRRPLKPTREPMKRPTPQPMSIRVGSTMSRQQIPVPSSSSGRESSVSVAAPAPATKPTLKKKGSNTSLHTSSSASSFKSSVSSLTQAQRKAQVASDRKKEQEREARRKEEQKRELERKRAAQQQQQEEARRQEMRSRAEAERERHAERERQAEQERRERSAQEDPNKAARMEAIKKRQAENARKHGRQGSQQIVNEGPILQHEQTYSQSSQRSDLGSSRPPSRLGSSIQPFGGRSINPPAPNPAKPPKRGNDETSHRPAPANPTNVQSSGEFKRRKTEDEHNPMPPVRTMAQPIRQSNIRKECLKPSTLGRGQSSIAPQSASSSYRNAQPQRPAHPIITYTNGKIPFAEPNQAPPPSAHKAAPSSAQRPPAKPSPKYPNGEDIHLPEVNTDSEDDDDSDSEMFPVPSWAQPKQLEGLLRIQEGMEVDSIFGPIAPFSLEDTFKADKKIKKYRERTSSANWSGPDGLTQEEIRKDVAERQRLRLNGGWSFNG
ncbi:uncharacterized protein N7500_002721 [Penicillium coprophilum]|uniref:uncharacterized protein n=1 Tax=Penicillium coprophilum TaxID=36646 RepID=UPI0023888882|nr:uncharacterized protein N7500_002721 [Penicillium coprophilum]KAJ5169938.1 hypothetical protein N7500_002721 [Penicillium coprophilum]